MLWLVLRWMIGALFLGVVTVSGYDETAGAATRDLTVMPKVAAGSIPMAGVYWAFIVGIDQYQYVPKLETAVRDATSVRDVLVERYGFRADRITLLLNEQATREGIEEALYRLGKQAGPTDSVFSYYAGHGQTDPETQRGYWVPVEGKAQSPSTFIGNALIRDEIAHMKAKHVYLVADSCFSGTLFAKSRALPPLNDKFFARLNANKSRWGLTSGQNEPVADQGKNGHSMFAYFLLKLLHENADPYLVPSHIYDQIAPLIGRNAEQQPRSEPLQNAGDEGGQFVFRLASVAAAKQPPSASSGSSGNGELEADRKRFQVERDAFEREKREAAERSKFEIEGKQLKEEQRHLAEQRVAETVVQTHSAEETQAQAASERVIRFHQEERAREAKENPQLQLESERREAEGLAQERAEQEQRDRVKRMVEQMRQGKTIMAVRINGNDGAPMVLVREGEFLYGENNQMVALSNFYIDAFEVTTKAYAAFMEATGHSKPEHWDDVSLDRDGMLPVIGVEYADADAYCRYYGKRLPTEEEWEKAARGTDGRIYPWGNTEPTKTLANYGPDKCLFFCNVYAEKLKPVNSYEGGRSPYGIYNMAGNAWEWVEGKRLRGGSWIHSGKLRGADLTVTNQSGEITRTWGRRYTIGFRCARDAK